jgi:hypothetical protein
MFRATVYEISRLGACPTEKMQDYPLHVSENPAFFYRCTKDANVDPAEVSKKGGILLANSKSLSFSILILGKAQERLD